MITYTPEQAARLRRDPLADLDAEHDAILELLSTSLEGSVDLDRRLRARARWRRLDAIRAQPILIDGSEPREVDNRQNPALLVELADTRDLIARAMARLSEEDQSILRARYFCGQRLQEIARALGCKPQSVHCREKRALKRLQPLLTSLDEELQ